MQNVTLRLPEDLVDELDAEADERNDSRSEYIREILRTRHEYEVSQHEYDELRREHDDLQQECERLRNANLTLIEERSNTQALVKYVESSWWERTKSRLFGAD